MADRAFPYLADVLRSVRSIIDQPYGDPQQLAHRDANMVLAAQESYIDLRAEIEKVSENSHLKVASGTITSGTNTLALPSDCSFLRRVQEVDSAGLLIPGGDIWVASLDKAGLQGEMAADFRPDQNHLYFSTTPTRTYSVRITHGFLAIPPVHGTVRDGSVSSCQLAEHESYESDYYNGLDSFYFFEGTGAGQAAQAILDYDGPTRTVTPTTNWGTAPTSNTRYTSRVELPFVAYNAYVADIVVRVLSRTGDPRLSIRVPLRERAWADLMSTLRKQERRSTEPIRDAYFNEEGFGDPFDDFG